MWMNSEDIMLSETISHKGQIKDDFTYMRSLEQSNSCRPKEELWLPGAEGKGEWNVSV